MIVEESVNVVLTNYVKVHRPVGRGQPAVVLFVRDDVYRANVQVFFSTASSYKPIALSDYVVEIVTLQFVKSRDPRLEERILEMM